MGKKLVVVDKIMKSFNVQRENFTSKAVGWDYIAKKEEEKQRK